MALVNTPKRRPTAHHKKASGKHHKATKDYLKTYWPYIPLGAIVAVGLLVNSVLTAPGSVLGSQSDFTSSSLLSDTNRDRSADNEQALSLNSQLSSAAQAKANDMVARNYWSHTAPDGKTPWSFIDSTGYSYTTAGENLAYGFSGADAVLQAWMNSPEHRANILNTTYQEVGFGVATSPDFDHRGPATVIVAMYGGHLAPAAVQNTPAPTAAAPNQPVAGATYAAAVKPVARVQLLTHSYNAEPVTVIGLAGIAAVIMFSLRHRRAWKRTLIKSEDFILEHIWIDMFIVTIATGSYLLLQGGAAIG